MVSDALPIHRLAMVVAFAVAISIVYAIDRPRGTWGRRLRSRLLLGVPWGTLVAIAVVVGIYLFVQSGIDDVHRPVVIPFRAWSYLYPEGILLAGLSHASLGHLTGNLLSTLVAGTLAEYAYGHFPRERGRSSFGSVRTNPFVRAFLFVPGAIVACAIFTSLFALGPVIGFSGVVFALWGVALINFPLGTIVALAASQLVRTLYYAFRFPVVEASASSSYSVPWWASIAVQGHALGFFAGILVGLWILRSHEDRPSALRLFAGALFFTVSQALWAVYWFRGEETFVLFRAAGVSLVVILTTVIAAAGAARAAPLFPNHGVDSVETFRDAVRSVTPRGLAVVLLVLGAAFVAGPAIPVNTMTTADEELSDDAIEIEGYQVAYVEDVPNGMVGVFDVDAFGETTAVNTSGVVVHNPDRHLWTTAVSAGKLEHDGRHRVQLGGAGWRETVLVERAGWRVVGGNATYRVDFVHDETRTTAFRSEPAEAEPTIAGRTVSVAAVEGRFEVRVRHGNETAAAPIPLADETVELLGLQIVRENDALFAEYEDTRVRIAQRQVPDAER